MSELAPIDSSEGSFVKSNPGAGGASDSRGRVTIDSSDLISCFVESSAAGAVGFSTSALAVSRFRRDQRVRNFS